MMNSSSRTRWPFTTSQWQELEHQALIFKYMISGMPIPPHLLCVIRSSYDSSLHLHQPPQLGGWSYYQMGTMKKVDPEPGRCKRTDGKKWRCSKEAYQDSKYCERHMHRGRNRSRKPVEYNNQTSTTSCSSPKKTTTNPVSSSSFTNRNSNSNSSSSPTIIRSPPPPSSTTTTFRSLPSDSYQFTSYATTPAAHHHHHHHHNLSRRADLSGGHENVSSLNNTLWESSGGFSEFGKGYRNEREEKVQVNELPFFSETCGNVRNMSGTSSLQVSGQRPSYHEIGLSSFPKIQSYDKDCRGHKRDYLGLDSHAKNDDVDDDEPKKVMHHFFDEWPCKEERFDSDEDKSSRNGVSSDIKLSISTPVPADHFFFARK